MGWTSIESYIDIKRLTFLWTLLALPFENIYKKVAIISINNHRFGTNKHDGSPCCALFETAVKYNLQEYIVNALDTGVMMDKHPWNKMVKGIVKDRYIARWNMTRIMYKKLYIFNRAIHKYEPIVWWKLCKWKPEMLCKCKLIVRLTIGEHGLNTARGRFMNEEKSNLCNLCNLYESETIEHFLFWCPANKNIRAQYEKIILESMPLAMKTEYLALEHKDKVIFLLSGLKGSFVQEWTDIYVNILNYVNSVYKHRRSLIKV